MSNLERSGLSSRAARNRDAPVQARKSWRSNDGARKLDAAIRASIRLQLSERSLSVRRISLGLGIPVRTLQRRLASHGLSFRGILNEVRFDEACEQLKRTKRPVADIAADLGYTDPCHFSRAFRRWSGEQPSTWRLQHCGKAK